MFVKDKLYVCLFEQNKKRREPRVKMSHENMMTGKDIELYSKRNTKLCWSVYSEQNKRRKPRVKNVMLKP
jgi:hypothetical protein